MRHKGRYAAIGYVTSKVVIPIAKRQAKRSAKKKAKGAVTGTGNAIRRNPGKTSVLLGTIVGAAGWLLTKGSSAHEPDE